MLIAARTYGAMLIFSVLLQIDHMSHPKVDKVSKLQEGYVAPSRKAGPCLHTSLSCTPACTLQLATVLKGPGVCTLVLGILHATMEFGSKDGQCICLAEVSGSLPLNLGRLFDAG